MRVRTFYKWLSLIFLVHTVALVAFFSDKIVEFNLNSSGSFAFYNQDAKISDQQIVIEELERSWQGNIIDNLFEKFKGADREAFPTLDKAAEDKLKSALENNPHNLNIDLEANLEVDQKDEGYPTEQNTVQTVVELELQDGEIIENEMTDNSQDREKPKGAELPTWLKSSDEGIEDLDNEDDSVDEETTTNEAGTSRSRPKMVLVMTQGRHGSTWLMDMLGYREDAVPVFEPLNSPKFLKMESIYPEFREEVAKDGYIPEAYSDWREVYLARICLCDWHGKKIPGKRDWHFEGIRGIRTKDQHRSEQSQQFYMNLCDEKTTMMVPKTIRYYNLTTLYKIQEFGCNSFKVIHLVRDPRAVLMSKMNVFHELFDGNKLLGPYIQREWPSSNPLQEYFTDEYMERAAEHMCSHHLENYRLGTNPPAWLQGRYQLVRYEDLAFYPDYWTQDLLDFIGVEYTPDYRQYVYNITHVNDIGKKNNGNFGVERQSSEMVDLWRKKLIERHWRTIERVCGEMMKAFGYDATFN